MGFLLVWHKPFVLITYDRTPEMQRQSAGAIHIGARQYVSEL